MAERRFLALDGMRGIAALAVLVIHMGGVPAEIFSGGYLAVDFFFCLSGFVLAHAYGDGSLSLGAFLKLRAIRLYPLYLAGLALGIITAAVFGIPASQFARTVALSLFFLPTPFAVTGLPGQVGSLYPLDPPAWSLFFEIVANAGWFAAARRLRSTAAVVLLAMCAAVFVGALTVYGVSAGAYWQNIWGGFARVAYSFLLGTLIYRLWRWSPWRPKVPSWLPALGLLAILCAPVNRALFDGPAVLLAMPALVFLGAFVAFQGSVSVLAQRALGDTSYAVYTLHVPIILLVDRAVSGFRLSHPSLISTPVTIALVIGLALWLDRFYDRPVRRWLTSLRREQTTAVPARS